MCRVRQTGQALCHGFPLQRLLASLMLYKTRGKIWFIYISNYSSKERIISYIAVISVVVSARITFWTCWDLLQRFLFVLLSGFQEWFNVTIMRFNIDFWCWYLYEQKTPEKSKIYIALVIQLRDRTQPFWMLINSAFLSYGALLTSNCVLNLSAYSKNYAG